MSEEYRSYIVGRVGPDGVEMFAESIDEGPVTPVRPEDFMAPEDARFDFRGKPGWDST